MELRFISWPCHDLVFLVTDGVNSIFLGRSSIAISANGRFQASHFSTCKSLWYPKTNELIMLDAQFHKFFSCRTE